MMVKAAKKALRQKTLALLPNVPEVSRQSQSESVLRLVLDNENYRKAKVVGIFISMAQEISTRKLIATSLEKGKRVFVPKVTKNRMTMLELQTADEIESFPCTKWGIPEPATGSRDRIEDIATSATDLVIVPAVAWNSDGKRLGYGGGYYDRYLNSLNAQRHLSGTISIRTLGIGLSCQLIQDSIPTNQYDVIIDEVIVGQKA